MRKEEELHRIFTEFVYNRSNIRNCEKCPVSGECVRKECWIEILTEDENE